MTSFELCNMTDLIFGVGKEKETGKYVKEFGGTRVMIVHTGEPFIRGLIQTVRDSIEAEGLSCIELTGVVPNPRYELVVKGAEICREEGVDFILGVGGGSTIDTSKAIAYAAPNPEIDLWTKFNGQYEAEWLYPILPIGIVSTFAGTGSEGGCGAIITRDKDKGTYDYIGMFPKFCIFNPEITVTVPPKQTASGAADTFSHLLESFMSYEPSDFADELIRRNMKTVLKHAPRVLADPRDLVSRAELMACANFPISNIIKPGRDDGDWGHHHIEHVLSGEYDVTHGAGLAVVIPIWMRHIVDDNLGLFVKLATQVFDLPMGSTIRETAYSAITATEHFLFDQLQLPRTLRGNGISTNATEDDVRRLTDILFEHETSGYCGGNMKLSREVCCEIMRECIMD